MTVCKVECDKCGKLISKSNYSKHIKRHIENPNSFNKESYKVSHDGLECQFCGKMAKNRNSLSNHERLCANNPDRHTSAIYSYNEDRKTGEVTTWNKGLTADTDDRVAKQRNSLLAYYDSNNGYWSGKTLPENMRKNIGNGVKQFLISNPDMVPYKRNHSSKESYPEMYFDELFQSEGIEVEKQYSVHSYHLDFCDPIKMVDIEIDGDQHYLDPKIVEHDKQRTEYLLSCGWKINRIRWSEFKCMDTHQKREVIIQIKELLK